MRSRQSNISHLFIKVMLTIVLIFSVGAGSVFADSASPTPAVTTNTVAATSLAPSSTPAAGAQTTLSTNEELQKPGLLPGDFFYFIKSAYEGIRMAIAVGDVKEARLLAE